MPYLVFMPKKEFDQCLLLHSVAVLLYVRTARVVYVSLTYWKNIVNFIICIINYNPEGL